MLKIMPAYFIDGYPPTTACSVDECRRQCMHMLKVSFSIDNITKNVKEEVG